MFKKTFPVIIVLIALSVLGVIILQVSWLNNQYLIQQERYINKTTAAAYNVKEEISRQIMNSLPRTNRLRNLVPIDLEPLMISRPSVGSRFTAIEVSKMIREALNAEGLKDVTFEFGVTNIPRGERKFESVELQSKDFIQSSLDTNNNRNISIPILSESSDLPVVAANENLWITITHFYPTVRSSLVPQFVAAGAFTIIILAAFFLMVKTILDQRKLSKIKNDFVNNMTHELKTPLATISLAVDALQNSKVISNPEKSTYFSDIIKQENKRMNKHVETILQAALMDKQDMRLTLIPLHAHDVIQKVVNTFTLQLNEKGGVIDLNLVAKNDCINADEIHFTNLINNLVDNAVKYSKEEGLRIIITTHSTAKNLVVQVQDNGIGMSKETVKRIFEKFYRAHTGNVHNVKGFGLGMSYVKSVVDAHNGRIRVDSVLGKGSTFTIDIPLYKSES